VHATLTGTDTCDRGDTASLGGEIAGRACCGPAVTGPR
jgi:hypothetical protein